MTTEQYDETRGKLNVVDSLITRIDNVRATGFVDEIVVEDHIGQKIEDIKKFDIDVIPNSNGIDGYTKASFIFDGGLAEIKIRLIN